LVSVANDSAGFSRSLSEEYSPKSANCTFDMYISNVYDVPMIKTINTTSLRNNLKEATSYVRESKKPLIITERGIPTSVLVDIDEYEDYLEAKDASFLESIKKARTDKTKGTIFGMDDVFGSIA
jgi:prevent-host-death family protein